MAKKKRNSAGTPKTGQTPDLGASAATQITNVPTNGSRSTAAATSYQPQMPVEVVRGDWTVLLFAIMMVLTPAMGVPHEEMLQDTLKSAIVSFAALGAALLFFWQQRNRREGLRWHFMMWPVLALCFYGLGSMVWSHTYLAGVEAIRWFVLSVLLWLGINTFSRDRLPTLAWGIHLGALIAGLWTALQFWIDFKFFPQGPNPASTFVNRNFYAEFAVCTLPFSFLLLARAKQSATISLLAFTNAFMLISIMMTGTRSALLATGALLLFIPLVLVLYRRQLAFMNWNAGQRILAVGVLLATIVGLGFIPTGNVKLIEEHASEKRGLTALERGFARTKSMTVKEEYTEKSFSVRLVMWKATGRIIQKRPLTGVGAGAWEADIPLYQTEGSQLETDYYVHNEILQLLGEYGVVGWLMLISLLLYLLQSAWRTLRNKTPDGQAEAPWRAMTLTAVLAFLIISNAGFPWRLASTAALFAVCLAILAASDARLGFRGVFATSRINWKPALSQGLAVAFMVCLALAAYITSQAAESEKKIVKATKIALTISANGDYANPKWDKSKAEMLKLIKEGTDINPHYRKITPMVADELAKWGDWKNAVWVWESVLSSRPYVVAIMSNVARGYASIGNPDKALEYLERAKKIQPRAPSVRSLEVILLSRTGKEAKGLELAREAVAANVFDYDLVNAAFVLAWRAGDFPFAVKTMDLRIKGWPNTKAAGLIQLGNMYLTGAKDPVKAFENFKAGMEAGKPEEKATLAQQVPGEFWTRLGMTTTVAAMSTAGASISSQTPVARAKTTPQTSASNK
jgi:O-antigen ligase